MYISSEILLQFPIITTNSCMSMTTIVLAAYSNAFPPTQTTPVFTHLQNSYLLNSEAFQRPKEKKTWITKHGDLSFFGCLKVKKSLSKVIVLESSLI
jgi:hypothetical protein